MNKTNPSFNSFSPFSLSNPYFAQTITIGIVIAVHRINCQRRMQPALSSPFPPPLSIIIVIVTIKIIISTHHAAASNAPLLPLPPPRCCRISKRAAATAKIAFLPSCRLRRQAGCRNHAPAAATSANAWQPP
jgi:hypothetical protein